MEEEVERGFECAVIAKVSGGEVPNKEEFSNVLRRLWRLKEGTTFKEIAPNALVVNFVRREARDRVMNGGPWLFNGWVILVDLWKPDQHACEVNAYSFNIWIQLHNLPLGFHRGKPLEYLGRAVGEIVLYQDPMESAIGLVVSYRFCRLLVRMDIRKPAVYGFYVARRQVHMDPFWVDVRYEKLPRLCFKCGMWSHEEDNCSVQVADVVSGGRPRFGPWLRPGFASANVSSVGESESQSSRQTESGSMYTSPVEQQLGQTGTEVESESQSSGQMESESMYTSPVEQQLRQTGTEDILNVTLSEPVFLDGRNSEEGWKSEARVVAQEVWGGGHELKEGHVSTDKGKAIAYCISNQRGESKSMSYQDMEGTSTKRPESQQFKLILGSSSVARRQIVTEMGYDFSIVAADIDEKSIRKDKPEELVMALAQAKADAILSKLSVEDYKKDLQSTLLITCDQVVVYDGKVREKPSSKEEAYRFLKDYSEGRAATVGSVLVTNLLTGVTKGDWDRVEIYFHEIPEEVITSLIEEGDVLYVAGGLLIEHPLIQPCIKEVIGGIDSVMGLPKELTKRLINEVL